MEVLQDRDVKLSGALGPNLFCTFLVCLSGRPERTKLLVTMIAFSPALTPAGEKNN